MLDKSPIRYSQSWEDHKVIEKGLNIKKGDSIVSILASGDNFLNMLRFNPKKIYGFDKNIAQFHEVKLKIHAIKNLEYDEFINFLGYSGKKEERKKIFRILSKDLEKDTYNFWKKNNKTLVKGIAIQGSTEKNISFQSKFFKFLLGEYYTDIINSSDKDEKSRIFEKKIDKSIFRRLSKLYNNRITSHFLYKKELLINLPRDFQYNKFFWEKIRRIFVDINCQNNPYLYWYFTGGLPEDRQFWQPYIQEKNFDIIKSNLDKIQIFNKNLYDGLKNIDESTIDAFYISDIFDWMDYEEINSNLVEIIRVAKNNAKLISFVIMHDKGITNDLKQHFKYMEKESEKLLEIDRVGFYPKICLWEIKKIVL